MIGSPGSPRGLPAALSLGAAAIHFAAAPDHFAEFVPFGIAFVGLGWFQVIWALVHLHSPSRATWIAAIAVNSGAVAAWLVARTLGLPFGPAPGVPEPIGLGDGLATAFEAGLVVVLVLAGARRAPAGAGRFTPSFGVALVGVAIVASVGVAAAASGHADHHHDVPAVLVPEPTTAPTGASSPSVGGSSAGSPIQPPSAGPSAAAATAQPLTATAPGQLLFGTRLGPDGTLYEQGSTFQLGQVVIWTAVLAGPIGSDEIRFQVVERRDDGSEPVHWDEAFLPPDPSATRIVAGSNLALYAHDGPGTYVLRYVRGSAVIAEGEVTLTPPS